MHVALVADESDAQGSAELYLSAGGNGTGAFGVLEDGVVTGDLDQGFGIESGRCRVRRLACLTPDNRDPRFHNGSLDREGCTTALSCEPELGRRWAGVGPCDL